MPDFGAWLSDQLLLRGMSQSDLARKTKISTAQVSRVCTNTSPPGIEFCKLIAEALDYEPSYVMEMAGLLVPSKDTSHIPGMTECMKTYENMSEEERQEVLSFMRYMLYKKNRER